jgi:hypothetical protein
MLFWIQILLTHLKGVTKKTGGLSEAETMRLSEAETMRLSEAETPFKRSAQTPNPTCHIPSSTPCLARAASLGPSSSEYTANTASG